MSDKVMDNPVAEGRVYLAYRNTINPTTGKAWTIKEISREVKQHYGYVRNRLALVSRVELKGKRNRMLSVEEMERLFDAMDQDNREGRRAIAECMGTSLELAIEESNARRSGSVIGEPNNGSE
jgi:hypothetical protein